MRMMPFFSLKYWMKHFREAICYILMVFCGGTLLSAMLFLMQGSKQLELEGFLTDFGNYDNSLMEVSVEYEDVLSSWDRVETLGGYYELGYGSINGLKARIGSFINEQSQELFYVFCDEGHYPVNEKEIAIDKTMALEMGVYPEVGNTILLTVSDDNGRCIDQREFVISGIYTIRDNTRYGGYIRNVTRLSDYEYPTIFLSSFWKEQFSPDTAFFCWQVPDGEDTCTYDEINSVVEEKLGENAGFPYANYVDSNNRTIAYSDITQTWGGWMTRGEFQSELNEKNYAKDFYQMWLIPAVALLICLLTFFSTYEAKKNIMDKRHKQINIYRELGVSRKKILFMVMLEVCIVLIVVLPCSLLAGTGVYRLIGMVYKAMCGAGLPALKNIDPYVKMVTWHPQFCAVCIMSISSFLAAGVSVSKMLPQYPMAEDESTFLKREKDSKERLELRKSAARLYCCETVRIKSISTIALLLNLSVSIGVLFFGIQFLQESFREKTNEYNAYLKEHSYDFHGENIAIEIDPYFVETGHKRGVTEENLKQLLSSEYISTSLAYGLRNSSMISGLTIPEGLEAYFDKNDGRHYFKEEDSDERNGEEAVYKQMGLDYEDSQLISPTLAVSMDQIYAFSQSVTLGTLSPELINAGTEVAILYTDEFPVDVTSFISVGQTLHINDCNPLEAAEEIGAEGEYYNSPEFFPVYENSYEVEDGQYRYVTYCLGKRVEYEARVGAMICISDGQMKTRLGLNDEKITILTTISALKSNGIMNQNYDQIYVSLNNRKDVEQFGKLWYPIVISSGMKSSDIVQIQKKVNMESYKDECVFYLLLILTVAASILGMLHSTQLLFALQKKNFAVLMALGMRRRDILFIKLRQQLWMLPAACCISLIPALAFQVLVEAAKSAMLSGADAGMTMVSLEDMVKEWYDYVPVGYDLFRKNWFFMWLIIILIVSLILVSVVTVGELLQKKINLQVELHCE